MASSRSWPRAHAFYLQMRRFRTLGTPRDASRFVALCRGCVNQSSTGRSRHGAHRDIELLGDVAGRAAQTYRRALAEGEFRPPSCFHFLGSPGGVVDVDRVEGPPAARRRTDDLAATPWVAPVPERAAESSSDPRNPRRTSAAPGPRAGGSRYGSPVLGDALRATSDYVRVRVALQSAVTALPASPSAAQIAAIATGATAVVSSVKSFSDASKSKCS